MNNFYLIGLSEVSKDQSLVNKIIPGIADRVVIGMQTVALGMLIVFSVLALLWIILEIAGRVSSAQGKEKAVPAPKTKKVEAPVAPVEEAPVDFENDEEIVAAITAAIALMLEAENAPVKGFRVVSFKRASNNAHWNR